MSSDREWREGLEAGDLVVYKSGGDKDRNQLIKVERTTATQIVLPSYIKFNKKTGQGFGFEAGCKYSQGFQTISKATPEAIKKIKESSAKKRAMNEFAALMDRQEFRDLHSHNIARINEYIDSVLGEQY